MHRNVKSIKSQISQPWLIAVILCTMIPVFPEYIAPFLAAGALIAAYFENKKNGTSFKIGSIGKILLIYLGYMAFGLFYSTNTVSTMSTIAMWSVMFCVYLALTTSINSRYRFDTAMFTVCLVAGIIGLIGISEYVAKAIFGLDVSMSFWSFIDNQVFARLPMRFLFPEIGYRASSTFNNPNIFAEYSVMIIPFAAYYAFDGERSKTSIFCRVCLIVSVLGVAFSFSRGSYMALLIVALIFLFTNLRKITSFIVVLATTLLLIPENVIARFLSVSSGASSIDGRFDIWHAGILSITKAPFFGHGAGTGATWNILLQHAVDAPHMHNLVIQLFAEGGIISVGIFALLGWRALNISLDLFLKNDKTRMLGISLFAFIAGFFVIGIFDFPLMTPKLIGTFVTIIAMFDISESLFLGKDLSSVPKSVFGRVKALSVKKESSYMFKHSSINKD